MIKTCNICQGKDVRYVDSIVIYHTKSYGMVYRCYDCGAYVGVHDGTNKPYGTLADRELRLLRSRVHRVFDIHWAKGRKGSRGRAYGKLARLMKMPFRNCHIGMFNKDQCKWALKILYNKF